VLSRHERGAEHQAADDCRRHRICACRPPADSRPVDGLHVARGTSQRSAEIDDHVEAEQREPDHRRGAVKAADDLERVTVEEPHRNSAAEEHDCRHDEQRREQTHGRLWRPLVHIGTATGVVAREPPADAHQLQDDRRNQGKTYEDVYRHERMHPEQDGGDFDEHGREQQQPDSRRQALVPDRIDATVAVHYLSGTQIGPGRRR
jgi:hypothetical protein